MAQCRVGSSHPRNPNRQRVTCATNQLCRRQRTFAALPRVVGLPERDGAFAQFCCVPTNQLFDVTASISLTIH